ncbi:MAG: hypothetical protein JXP34_15475 [Planctomycetes bacterium]|nr:hypothetical protein [Planctomycetota bacterium]
MDPADLIAPSSPLGYPAPYALMAALKVLGFTLHTIPMGLWFAGLPVALLLRRARDEDVREIGTRLARAMPVLIALGINLGIVPLLFLQVAYHRAFYPATILMAWPWLSVIALLTLAYYGVYVHVIGIRRPEACCPRLRRAAGWVAAVLFAAIGFLFANALSLMTNIRAWPDLWERTSAAAAPLGTGLNLADPTLWPRLGVTVGLALLTTAAFIVIDAAHFARPAPPSRGRAAGRTGTAVATAGLAVFAAAGTWYVFGAWPAPIRSRMLGGANLALTAATALSAGLPWLLIVLQRAGVRPALAAATGAAQFLVLALNAISRQVVQNAELLPWVDVTAEPVRTQWSPLILFLVLLVAGLAAIAWMVRQILAVSVPGRE